MKSGKLIVIEGIDGSGKATQIKLLSAKLKKIGIETRIADFPQYGNPSAFFVEKYLRGEYGTAKEVGPYRGSLFYALDRYDKSFEIKKWLESGKIVLCNRYVSANMGHQAGKISDKKERTKFIAWLEDLEYGIFNIPRPDLTIFLNLSPVLGQALAAKRSGARKGDIHESDLSHLKKSADAYLSVAKKSGWKIIKCENAGKILSPAAINDLIFEAIISFLK